MTKENKTYLALVHAMSRQDDTSLLPVRNLRGHKVGYKLPNLTAGDRIDTC